MAGLREIAAACAALAALVSLPPSPAPAAEREQGILEIRIKDHREAIDDFAKLSIVIEKILISPRAGLGLWSAAWKDLGARSETVDLTKYAGKTTAKIFRGSIDAGSFDAFHVKLKSIGAVLKRNQRPAPVKNAVAPVQTAFEVPPSGETVLVIDLVVTDFSDHPPRGYEMGVRGYEVYTNGKLKAKIPPG